VGGAAKERKKNAKPTYKQALPPSEDRRDRWMMVIPCNQKACAISFAVVSEMLSTPPAGEWNPLSTPQFMTPSATWRVQHSAYKRTRQNYNRGHTERTTLLLPLPTRVKEVKEKGTAAVQRSS
jgi:hypothetical protein